MIKRRQTKKSKAKPAEPKPAKKISVARHVMQVQLAYNYRFSVVFSPAEWRSLEQESNIRPRIGSHASVIRMLIRHHLRYGLLENYEVPRPPASEQIERTVWLSSRDVLRLKVMAAYADISATKALRILVNILAAGSHIEVFQTKHNGTRARLASLRLPMSAPDTALNRKLSHIIDTIRAGLTSKLENLTPEEIEVIERSGKTCFIKELGEEISGWFVNKNTDENNDENTNHDYDEYIMSAIRDIASYYAKEVWVRKAWTGSKTRRPKILQ